VSDPETIQQQIERTRADLSQNVDQLTEKVSPPRVVGRQVDRVKSQATSLRDRVMGSAEYGTGLRGAGDSVGSAADTAKETVKQTLSAAPQTARAQTQGNPLAAGLVAFGLGMVISSLLPASQPEKELAARVEDKAKDLTEPAKQAGQQIVDELKPAVQDAAEQVKSSAQHAAQATSAQAKSKTEDVTAPLQQ